MSDDDLHTCHDECPLLACVQGREIRRLESEIDALRATVAAMSAEKNQQFDDQVALRWKIKELESTVAEVTKENAALRFRKCCQAQCNAIFPGDPSMCDAMGEQCVCLNEEKLQDALTESRRTLETAVGLLRPFAALKEWFDRVKPTSNEYPDTEYCFNESFLTLGDLRRAAAFLASLPEPKEQTCQSK